MVIFSSAPQVIQVTRTNRNVIETEEFVVNIVTALGNAMNITSGGLP